MLDTAQTTDREALAAKLAPAQRAELDAATERLELLQASATQRDWLLITQALNRTRAEVIEDGGLRLLALAFVKEKREHGGASWDVLLDMTDDQLLELHGFPDLTEQPADQSADQSAEQAPRTFAEGPPLEGERDYSAQVTPPTFAEARPSYGAVNPL